MFELPNLTDSSVFPFPEGANLEFKQGFNSCPTIKIVATMCGILNSGGGYLVIGVEDGTQRILGIKTDKSMDNFLLMLDSIYRDGHIKKNDGTMIPIGTIVASRVQCANKKEIMAVRLTAEPKQIYTTKDGIWHRLSASNYKQPTLQTIYSEKDVDTIVSKKLSAQTSILHQQFEIEKLEMMRKFHSEQDKLKAKFHVMECDFTRIVEATKQTEHTLTEMRDLLYKKILFQKSEAEKELAHERAKGWYAIVCFM